MQVLARSLVGGFLVGNYLKLLSLEVKFPLALRTDPVMSLNNLQWSLEFEPVVKD